MTLDPLHGRRILHVLSPVQFDKGVFNHERDSNYQCTERFVQWFPQCHHYVLVPTRHKIADNRSNVTLLKYPYPTNAVSNRSMFNAEAFLKVIDLKQMDFDFLFVNQPELLYNVLVALMDRRYGEILHRFSFFHWIDCSASRGSPAIPHGYMRQLEAINQSTRFFVHSDVALDYLGSNFKRPNAVNGLNREYLTEKMCLMPTAKMPFDGQPKPFPLPTDKRIVVFNHRWSQSTGMNRFLEYTRPLLADDRYLLWVTDPNAEDLPKGYHQSNLSYAEYLYLLQNAYCSVCFVDGYATWNLSVQDGVSQSKPVLVYDHPMIDSVLGKDSDGKGYPFKFKTQEEFLSRLEKLPSSLAWPLPEHDKVFHYNLFSAMRRAVLSFGETPKDAPAWMWCIAQGLHFKADISNQVQENIMLNSVWQYIRRWLMNNGITDNPNSSVTSYSIIESERPRVMELIQNVKMQLKPKSNKETVITRKDHGFWD